MIYFLEEFMVVLIGSRLPVPVLISYQNTDKMCGALSLLVFNSLQIHVHREIPDGITVTVEPFQGDDDDPKSQFLENFSVEHLAPLSLTCLMPPSYPSHHPPHFTLGVQWLDNVKVSSLCHMLDSIWAQQAE